MSEVGLEEFTHLFGAMTDGFDRMCKALNVSDKLTIDEVVNEVAALTRRVSELEAALKPFQHPDFTKISGTDTRPVFGYDNATLTVGDFRRACSLFGRPLPAPVPAQPETPVLTAYQVAQIARAEKPSGLQGKK